MIGHKKAGQQFTDSEVHGFSDRMYGVYDDVFRNALDAGNKSAMEMSAVGKLLLAPFALTGVLFI
ncbi:MAG: hypothetical protein AAF950_13650 [Pseudomonadota bacterium]